MKKVTAPIALLATLSLGAWLSLTSLSIASADEPRSGSGDAPLLAPGIGIRDAKSAVVSGLEVTTSGKLLFSLALILGGYALFMRYRGNRVNPSLSSELRVTSKLMLTPRTALILVKVHDRSVLCAVGPEQVSIIPTDSPITVPFQDLLGSEESLETEKLAQAEAPSPSERSLS